MHPPTDLSSLARRPRGVYRRLPVPISSFAALLFALAASRGIAGEPLPAPRTLTAETRSEGVTRLTVQGGVGAITVRPSSDGMIRAEVRCEIVPPDHGSFFAKVRSWLGRSDMAERVRYLAAVELNSTAAQNSLVLKVQPQNRDRLDTIREHWTLTVPPHLALDLRLDVGNVEVAGVEGGVDVDLRVGNTRAALPDGDLRVRTDVGDVTVHAKANALGRLEAATRVGQTALAMHGVSLPTEREHGPGGKISLRGKGTRTVDVSVDVGDVAASFD